MAEPLAYLNGKMIPASEARLPVYDAGIVQGAAVSELTRTFNHEPYRLDIHLSRLLKSLYYMFRTVTLRKKKLSDISHELVEHNRKFLDKSGELGLVHFVTAGSYPTFAGIIGRKRSLSPTVCIHTFPVPFELWAKKMRTGANLYIPTIRHIPPQCHIPNIKHRSRMHFYLADQEVRYFDPEASALLLDLNDNVTETSTANFLMVAERFTIVSPKPDNILPGVSKAVVKELAKRLGLPFEERDIDMFTAMKAKEAFLASTPYCLMPVTRINGAIIGDGRPGPVFRRLMEAWSQEVGLDIVKQIREGARGERRGARGEGRGARGR